MNKLLFIFVSFIYCIPINANQGDTVLYLNRMQIDNKRIIKEIKRNLKDMKDVYNLSAPNDTFLIFFYTISNYSQFTVIAKGRKNISKYEISEDDIRGYTIIKNDYFIICGKNDIYVKEIKDEKEKKEDHFSLILSDILPIIDGWPPCWTFRIEKKRIKLVERFIPKGNNYHIKFP